MVSVGCENILTGVASVDHMILRAGIFNAQRSCHIAPNHRVNESIGGNINRMLL
jgi:hypothetical protein